MTETKYDIVAIGNAIVDILAFENDDFLESHNIEKSIMTLTDRKTVDRLFLGTPNARKISGGSAANTAVGLASCGGTATFIGKVGVDPMGNLFTSDIRKMGVDFIFTPPEKTSNESSACSYIIVTPDAQRTMLTYLGVAAQLSLRDIREETIAGSKICYLEGYLWDDEEAINCIRQAIIFAKKHDRQIAFSLSDPFCVERHRDDFLELIDNDVDILFANEAEITALYQVSSRQEAIDKVHNKCEITAITLGEEGSVIINKDAIINITPFKVDTIIDTTGAGDLYASGFLYGYTQGKNLQECGYLGSLAASEIISHLGARPEQNLAKLIAQEIN